MEFSKKKKKNQDEIQEQQNKGNLTTSAPEDWRDE